MIHSKGITIDNFYIPPFSLAKGEILIIELPNGPFYSKLHHTLVSLTTGKEIHENVRVKEKFTFAAHVGESRWRSSFLPMTVKQYIRKWGNPDSAIASKIYDLEGIKPETKISRLAGIDKKMLSLCTILSYTNKIIFDLSALDPMGGIRAYTFVKDHIGQSGAAILIDHCPEFKNDCSRHIKYELLP